MADEAEATEQRTCFKCGEVPVPTTLILCNRCRDRLEFQTAHQIYAALPH